MPAHLVGPLRNGIEWTQARESVVFGLVTDTRLKDRRLLLVRHLIELPADAYLNSSRHGAKWRGAAMLPVLNEALAGHYGVVMFHSHPEAGPVSFSGDDRDSAQRLLPTFQTIVPARAHGSIVVGQDHAAGMVLLPDMAGYATAIRLRLLDGIITDLPSGDWPGPTVVPDELYHRQALLTGSAGEAKLRNARVVVVGLSGGGSHAVQQLAYMGTGEIIGIDDAKAKRSHRARLIGISWLDPLIRRRKTAIMARLVRRINRRVKFTGISERIPRQGAIDALKEADIVVGCVDSFHARADLQDLCSRYLIPYVDIGLLICPINDGPEIVIGGNVVTAVPGSFCQWCAGVLSQERLDAETGGRPRSYFLGTDGQAQVVSMNGSLASEAATEVLRLLTGFAPVDGAPTIKKYNGLAGTLEEWVVTRTLPCPTCRDTLGAGEVIWRVA